MKILKFKKLFYIIIFFVNLCAYSQEKHDCRYVINTYYNVLNAENRNALIKFLPKVEKVYHHTGEYSSGESYESTWIDYYDVTFGIQFIDNAYYFTHFYSDKGKKAIYIGDVTGYFCFIDSMEFYKNETIVSAHSDKERDNNDTIIDFPIIKKQQNYEFKFVFDGDYLDLFINGNFIHKFCRIDQESLKQYENLIQTNTCDLSKVTWPRHADGTSEYDDKIIVPKPVKLFENEAKTEEITNTQVPGQQTAGIREKTVEQIPEPGTVTVKKNNVMVLAEDSVVRFDPSSEGTFMTSVVKGAAVKIKKVGRKETINGVTSNWVLINFAGDAYNTKGKKNIL